VGRLSQSYHHLVDWVRIFPTYGLCDISYFSKNEFERDLVALVVEMKKPRKILGSMVILFSLVGRGEENILIYSHCVLLCFNLIVFIILVAKFSYLWMIFSSWD
jgi:hypothetical protein